MAGYLTLVANGPQSIKIHCYNYSNFTSCYSSGHLSFEYSTNGTSWSSFTWTTSSTTYSYSNTVQFTKLYIRGLNTKGISLHSGNLAYTRFEFGSDSSIYCSGNIMHLINYSYDLLSFPTTSGVTSGFYNLFANCTALVTAPSLPATSLSKYCYAGMFKGCTRLLSAPALPATTLAQFCYLEMFYGCTGLTSVQTFSPTTLASNCCQRMFSGCTFLRQLSSSLPATKLAEQCYYEMFYGCTRLTSAPALPATTLAKNCYYKMFYGCTELTSAPALPATTLIDYCYYEMFYGCASLTSAPALPATTLIDYCYFSMFYECTGLTSTPALPATTLAKACYNKMFYGCTSLTSESSLPATTLAVSCYDSMFYGCTSLTSAPALPATTLTKNCYQLMFFGCTSLTSVSQISATTLAEWCCGYMFQGCSNLILPPALPATTLAKYCYTGMFMDCSNLRAAPTLPATTLAENCYGLMFKGCVNLTGVVLPGTTLVTNCYNNMFAGCSNLRYIKALFTNAPSTSYTSNWVAGVYNTGTFVKSPDATWNIDSYRGVNGVPVNWNIETNNNSGTNNFEIYGIWTGMGVPTKIYKGSSNVKEVWLGNQRIWPIYYFSNTGNQDPSDPVPTYEVSMSINVTGYSGGAYSGGNGNSYTFNLYNGSLPNKIRQVSSISPNQYGINVSGINISKPGANAMVVAGNISFTSKPTDGIYIVVFDVYDTTGNHPDTTLTVNFNITATTNTSTTDASEYSGPIEFVKVSIVSGGGGYTLTDAGLYCIDPDNSDFVRYLRQTQNIGRSYMIMSHPTDNYLYISKEANKDFLQERGLYNTTGVMKKTWNGSKYSMYLGSSSNYNVWMNFNNDGKSTDLYYKK